MATPARDNILFSGFFSFSFRLLYITCFIIFSSTYDLCSILNTQFVQNGVTQCPLKWAKQGLPCSCPIKAGTYTLNPDVWTIPAPSALLSSMSAVSIIGCASSRYDNHGDNIVLRVLKDLATIFRWYRGSQVYLWRTQSTAPGNKCAIELHCQEIYNAEEV